MAEDCGQKTERGRGGRNEGGPGQGGLWVKSDNNPKPPAA